MASYALNSFLLQPSQAGNSDACILDLGVIIRTVESAQSHTDAERSALSSPSPGNFPQQYEPAH